MDETELKFVVPDAQRTALEMALRRGKVRVERMRAIYFDTDGQCLSRHGIAVRLRKEGRQWIQTAKANTADPFRRLEHNVPIQLPIAATQPILDLSLHDREPVGQELHRALDACRKDEDDATLTEQFRTDVERVARTVRSGGARVELSLDTGEISARGRSLAVCEFELELKSGTASELLTLAARWSDRHRLWLSTVSKAEHGLRLARGEQAGHPTKAASAAIGKNIDLHAFVTATIGSCMKQVLGNASEIAAGAEDEEFVHQLRIGLRRLRTALGELTAGSLGSRSSSEERALRGAFQELGYHRDRSIIIPAVRAEISEAGFTVPAEPEPTARARSPREVVCDPHFQRALLDVLVFLKQSPEKSSPHGDGEKAVRALVAKKLAAVHRLLGRDADRFSELHSSRQHRVRKRLKRLRYLSEFAAPLFGVKRVSRYLAYWRKAQDALGRNVDLSTAFATIATPISPQSECISAASWFEARRKATVKRCQRALHKATKQQVYWKK